jgi:hypothetical protein
MAKPENKFIRPGTRLYDYEFASGLPTGGHYVESGKVTEEMLEDEVGLIPRHIMGTPDGRRPNSLLGVESWGRHLAVWLEDLKFADETEYSEFRDSFQGSTRTRLPQTLEEWKKRYSR